MQGLIGVLTLPSFPAGQWRYSRPIGSHSRRENAPQQRCWRREWFLPRGFDKTLTPLAGLCAFLIGSGWVPRLYLQVVKWCTLRLTLPCSTRAMGPWYIFFLFLLEGLVNLSGFKIEIKRFKSVRKIEVYLKCWSSSLKRSSESITSK